jgi:hypothetical protein
MISVYGSHLYAPCSLRSFSEEFADAWIEGAFVKLDRFVR